MSVKPWITYEAQKHLDSIIQPDWSVFEWGSGNSTLYFANGCRMVFAVEHDAMWHMSIREKLLDKKNVSYFLKPAEPGNDTQYTIEGCTSYEHKKGYSFRNYVGVIDMLIGTYDLISVDGRARIACIEKAIKHLNPGGVIMLDNSERKHYQPGKDLLNNFRCVEFSGEGEGGTWTTSFYHANK